MEYLYYRLLEKAGVKYYVISKTQRVNLIKDCLEQLFKAAKIKNKEKIVLKEFKQLNADFNTFSLDELEEQKFGFHTFQNQEEMRTLIFEKLKKLENYDVSINEFQDLLDSTLPFYYYLIYRLKEMRAKNNEFLLKRIY